MKAEADEKRNLLKTPGGGGWRGVCVVEAAGWRVCKGGGRGQTGNDEVIAKRKAGWEGGEPGGVTLIQR